VGDSVCTGAGSIEGDAAVSPTVPHTTVRPTPPLGLAPVGVDAQYSAFPGACQHPDGTVRLVWRQGSNHATAYDGAICTATSADQGLTWSNSTVAVAGTPGSVDLRDPSISLSADGATSYLTYFKATPASTGAGCFVRASTDGGVSWGAETRIDSGLATACITAPLVGVGGGLIAVFYGKASGDAHDSCWASTSTDGGSTWSAPNRLANGVTAGFDYQEPRLVAAGVNLRVFFRHGNSNAIGSVSSPDGGTTYTAPVIAFGNASGRPSAAWLGSGTLVVSYRSTTTGAAYVRASHDGGATWLPAAQQTTTVPGTLGMTYSNPLPLASGAVFCPVANELSTTSSKLYTGYLVDGPGRTPLGDEFLGEWAAAAAAQDQILYADRFSYPDGVLPAPWAVATGGLSVSGGMVVSTTTDNVPDVGVLATGNQDVVVEADLMWTGQAGVAVLARWSGPGDYLKFTVESGGTAARLYANRAGTLTTLVNASFTSIAGTWLRMKLMVRQNLCYLFINDYTVAAVSLPSATGSDRHGFSLNAQPGGMHYCRRFVVRS
jgi:BNR repeat-like domain